MDMRVMFVGGGTGGHIYPALAVAEEIMNKKPETEILFVAGNRGIERKIVTDAGFPLKTIPVTGLPRKLTPALVTFAWKLMVSILKSRKFMRCFKPSVMMATGGYVSGPPIIAAFTMGIPVVIQEQNSFPGITNRKLARLADLVFLGFGNAEKYFGKSVETMTTGNPVRSEIGTGIRAVSAEIFNIDPSLKTVLIFGGSQGAHAINSAVSKIVEHIAENDIQVLWQTGRRDYDLYSKFDRISKGKVRVLSYIDDMVSAYTVSDMVVCRAGAMTIAEITVCGLPAVFIPLPTAAGNHQEYNARSLADADAAVMILERDLASGKLEHEITCIITSEKRLSSMSEASRRLAKKDAAGVIAGVLLERYAVN
ncbi:undecaprenyldiphospho-muramoylpentapeptide beta-N-acetylglucosaminyltransferase [Candidatus Latescibacterota bacterium]